MATIKVKLSNQYVASGVAGSTVPQTWVAPNNLMPQVSAYSPDYGKGVGYIMPFMLGTTERYTYFVICFNHNEIAGVSKLHYLDYINNMATLAGPAVPGTSTAFYNTINAKLGNSKKQLLSNVYMKCAVTSAQRLNSLIASTGDNFQWDVDYQLFLSPFLLNSLYSNAQTVPGSTFPSQKAHKWMNSSDIQGSAAPVSFAATDGDGDGKTGPSMITSFQPDGNVGATSPLSAAGAYNYNKYSGSHMTAFYSVSFAPTNGVPSVADAEIEIDKIINGEDEVVGCWDSQAGEDDVYKFTICCDGWETLGRVGFPSEISVLANEVTEETCGLTYTIPADVYYDAMGAEGGTNFDALCGDVSACYQKADEPEEGTPTTDWSVYGTLKTVCCSEDPFCTGEGEEPEAGACQNLQYDLCEECEFAWGSSIILPGACDNDLLGATIQVKHTPSDEVCCFALAAYTLDPVSDLTDLELISEQDTGCEASPCSE